MARLGASPPIALVIGGSLHHEHHGDVGLQRNVRGGRAAGGRLGQATRVEHDLGRALALSSPGGLLGIPARLSHDRGRRTCWPTARSSRGGYSAVFSSFKGPGPCPVAGHSRWHQPGVVPSRLTPIEALRYEAGAGSCSQHRQGCARDPARMTKPATLCGLPPGCEIWPVARPAPFHRAWHRRGRIGASGVQWHRRWHD